MGCLGSLANAVDQAAPQHYLRRSVQHGVSYDTFFFASKFALFATVFHFFATPPSIFATHPSFFATK
jgi:hypothetical protein